MKNKKLIIILVLLFICSISTYAIYRVRGNVGVNLSTAKWNVKVKDKELKTAGTVDLTFTKNDIVWESNSKVKEGTIAPGSKGTINFNVDATGTEVSTDVLVKITKTNDNPNINVTTNNDYTFINVNDTNKVKAITINIEWLKNDDDANNTLDNNEINKLFDINVKVTVKQSFKELKLLRKAILKDNGGIDTIKAKETPDFSKAAATKEGMFMAEDDYGESYYYRGVADNWVSFAGFYWHIIRINGDGSIRLIYSGTKTNNTGAGKQIGASAYNTSSNGEKYADYKISTVKNVVDNWYKTNILDKGYDNKIADTGYCNDMSKVNAEVFGAGDRLYINKRPTLRCPNKDIDLLSKGNNKLTYAVGLLTWDEASFAGGSANYSNTDYYLYNGTQYWTMTPVHCHDFRASVGVIVSGGDTYGDLYDNFVNYSNGVRPILSLKSDVTIRSGDGTETNPYVVN